MSTSVRVGGIGVLLAVFAAASLAFAQGDDALPKHPIPYKALHAVKKKPTVKHTTPAATPAPPPAQPGAVPPPPGAHPAPPPSAQHPAAPAAAPPPNRPTPSPVTAPPPAAPARPAPAPPKTAPPPVQPPIQPGPIQPAPVSTAPPPPPLPSPQAGARLHAGQAMSAEELEAFVDGQISRAMTGDHIAGVAVAVVQNGQLVMEKGYGSPKAAANSRIDARTSLIRLGSASQLFTWIAALKAVEDGRLKLDGPVNTYLPPALKTPDEGFDKPILFRHLMTHTAGFEDRALGRRYVRDPEALVPLGAALDRFRPRRVRAAGLLSVPSDYGVALAGQIVAQVEGRPFDQMIEDVILRPLGLSHTSFREPYPASASLPEPLNTALAGHVADGYHWTGQDYVAQPFSYGQSLAPAIAASTTADDMARLMIALLNGGKLGDVSILNPASAALLRTPLQQPFPGVDGWAHGFAMQQLPGGFEALSQVGSTPTFRSGLFLIPGLNTGVFVVANTDTGGPLTRELAGAIVNRFYGGENPQAEPAPRAVDYTGAYLSAQRAYHGLEAFADRLARRSTLTLDAAGGVALTDAGGVRVFEPMGAPDRFRSPDGRVLLTPAMGGRVQAYVFGSGGGAAERVGGLHSVKVLEFWAALTMLAIIAGYAGLFIRDRPDARASRAQTIARVTQLVTGAVWCVAFAAFALFLRGGLSEAVLMFDWPNRWLVTASWAALIAGLLTLVMVVQLPGAWREERRIAGWSAWRKLRHTGTIGVFLVFTAILAAWGALEPLSS